MINKFKMEYLCRFPKQSEKIGNEYIKETDNLSHMQQRKAGEIKKFIQYKYNINHITMMNAIKTARESRKHIKEEHNK